MNSRFRIAFAVALLLSLILAIPVFAGGWAVITLDELPVNATVGEPLKVGFTVLQHGQTPTTGLSPKITVRLPKDEQFVVIAEEEGAPGHYSAELTFPKEGEWEWSIEAFIIDQPMPTINVAAAPVTKITGEPVKQAESIPYALIVRGLAFGLGLVGLFFTFRSKSRFAMVLTALCLMVGVASFIPGAAVPKVEAQKDAQAKAVSETSITQVELGRRLFIAKGCITCHVNHKAVSSGHWTVTTDAPNLSEFSASPEALRLRLKDPASLKSDTWMPDLNLSDPEIEALIAFINSK